MPFNGEQKNNDFAEKAFLHLLKTDILFNVMIIDAL
jgi:hypothetical protein